MEEPKYKYHEIWKDECRQWIKWKESCAECCYDMLCIFQYNQEREWVKKHGQKKTSEKN
jgi:hypothetical protein